MDTSQQNKALTLSIVDGALSAVMGSLAGGMFLMGFALKILFLATVNRIGYNYIYSLLRFSIWSFYFQPSATK